MHIELTDSDDRELSVVVGIFATFGYYRVVGRCIDGKFYLIGVKV